MCLVHGNLPKHGEAMAVVIRYGGRAVHMKNTKLVLRLGNQSLKCVFFYFS